MITRFFGLFDNTRDTHRTYLGILNEDLARLRLKMQKAIEDDDRSRLKAAIVQLEEIIRQARNKTR